MDRQKVLDILIAANAFITESHLLLTNGGHTNAYINLRNLEGNVQAVCEISTALAEAIGEHEDQIFDLLSEEDQARRVVIVGPETFGRSLAEATAIAGGFEYYAWCVMAKDENGKDIAKWSEKMSLQDLIKGSRCYGVDDMDTTGGSMLRLDDLIEKSGGIFEGGITVVRRDTKITAEKLGLKWLSQLLDYELAVHDKDSCPFCKARRPFKRHPGHAHELENTPGYEDYPFVD